MAQRRIALERSAEGVLTVLLDRPAKRNALDGPAVEQLLEAFGTPDVRAFVLASSDPLCFCAGADLTLGDDVRAGVSDQLYELYQRMLHAPAPIVAALGGAAVGGGAQLAIASDLRVATPGTTLRFPGPGHGLAVGAWGLPSLVGRGRALDLCLTMRPVGAEEAAAIGLVDRVVDDARGTAAALAAGIATLDPSAATRVKRVAADAAGALLAAVARERGENRAAWSGSTAGLAKPRHGGER
jgi:enoyl-CoA hydratase/carnithine racemase